MIALSPTRVRLDPSKRIVAQMELQASPVHESTFRGWPPSYRTTPNSVFLIVLIDPCAVAFGMTEKGQFATRSRIIMKPSYTHVIVLPLCSRNITHKEPTINVPGFFFQRVSDGDNPRPGA